MVDVEHLPGDRHPKTVWLWSSAPDATPAAIDRWRQSFLRRFDLDVDPVAAVLGRVVRAAVADAVALGEGPVEQADDVRDVGVGASSVVYTPVILQETSATKTGTWSARSSTSHLGGKSYSSAAKGTSLSWTFTGRSASSSTTQYRQAIWTKSWSTSAKHTVEIAVVGTSGRPTVTTDGLAYIK